MSRMTSTTCLWWHIGAQESKNKDLSCPIFLWTIGYFVSGGRVVDYMPHQEQKEQQK